MKLREAEMGDGTEPVYKTDHNRQAEDTLDEQQYAEEQGSLKATSSMPRDTDILVGKGNIKDGSAFGKINLLTTFFLSVVNSFKDS